MTIWDDYEDKVQNHFIKKELERVGAKKGGQKLRVSLDSKLYKKQPNAFKELFQAEEGPNEEDPNEVIRKNMRTISLAKSMVAPRPDNQDKTMRLTDTMAEAIATIRDSVDTDNIEDLVPD